MQRQLNGTGAFEGVATVGEKTYADTTLPTGTASAIYRVYGLRNSLVSADSTNVAMSFGRVGGSTMMKIVQSDRAAA